MMRAAVSDFNGCEFYIAKASNFMKVPEDELTVEFVQIADKIIMPGDRVTLIGKETRKARTVKLNEGDYLEYRGTYTADGTTTLLFAVNGLLIDDIYESMFYQGDDRLFIITNYGNSAMDIQANEIKLLEDAK